MLRRFGIKFNPLQMNGSDNNKVLAEFRGESFNRKVKIMINAVILEGRSCFLDFNKLMQEVFTIPNPADPSQRIPLKNTRVGMKFKSDMPIYTEEEIEDIGVPIKSPEVLRVLIKWINKLDEIAK